MLDGSCGHHADCQIMSYNAAEMGGSAAITQKAEQSQVRT